MVETGENHAQVPIGALVRVENSWKLIDVPQIGNDATSEVALKGYFIPDAIARAEQRDAGGMAAGGAGQPNAQMQQFMKELEEIDKVIASTTDEKQLAKLNADRADKVQQLADEDQSPEGRAMWIKQLADTVSVAVQTNTYPDGVQRLKDLLAKLKENDGDKNVAAFVEFRLMSTEYNLDLIKQEKPFNQVQAEWLKRLEQFVTENEKSPDLADALIQLAMAEEMAGEEEKALQWYNQITTNYSQSPYAKKAEGAKRRLTCEGKPIPLKGNSLGGKTIDLNSKEFRNKVVLIHYWSTDESNVGDLPDLKDLIDRYGNEFAIIGVSLENDKERLSAYLEENPLKWPQIWEEGGLENRLANEMGILTLPTMILIDKQGRVVSRSVVANQLAKELRQLINPAVGSKSKKNIE
jgi:TolA-binding protein